MQKRCVLIYNGCRLHAEVAIHVVEIESGDAMFAHGAFKCGAAIHRFGRVISHIFDYNPLRAETSSNARIRDLQHMNAADSDGNPIGWRK